MKATAHILTTKALSALVILLTASFFMASCEKADLSSSVDAETEQGTSSSESHKVTIVTRSAVAQEISYPIDIYAYNAQGEEAAHQTVTSASEGISMSLHEGQYTIAATSGLSSFDKSKGYSTVPLLTGSTTVTVESSALTANIVLSYAVAALDLSLTDVPSSVTAVSVTVASQYTGISNLREYSGSTAITVPCSKTGSTWQTGTVYVLPGCKESTALTVSLTSPSGTVSYGITYPDALKAATPYHFTGSYSGEDSGVKLTGTLTSSDWLAAVNGSFSFGPSGSNSFGGSESSEVIKVSSLPAQGSVWDGHLVVLAGDNTDGSADALLLSTTEWSSLTSALYETDPGVPQKIADGYVEGALGGWTIPTTEQVKSVKAVWSSDNIATLNTALAAVAGSTPLAVTDDEGKNIRYLCEGATYTYSWAKGGSILSAGKSVKTYRLRLVKRVRFQLS